VPEAEDCGKSAANPRASGCWKSSGLTDLRIVHQCSCQTPSLDKKGKIEWCLPESIVIIRVGACEKCLATRLDVVAPALKPSSHRRARSECTANQSFAQWTKRPEITWLSDMGGSPRSDAGPGERNGGQYFGPCVVRSYGVDVKIEASLCEDIRLTRGGQSPTG